jgi:hypothetical protein
MIKSRKAEKANILAVEGKDEYNFFTALINHLHLTDIQIEDMGGKDRFKNEFPLLAQSEKFYDIVKNIGFVRDAEKMKPQQHLKVYVESSMLTIYWFPRRQTT